MMKSLHPIKVLLILALLFLQGLNPAGAFTGGLFGSNQNSDAPPEVMARDIAGLENPRETFRTFLTNMLERRERAALRALDLSDIPAPIRTTRGGNRARLLYEIINRLGHVDYNTIPTEVEDDIYYFHTRVADIFELELIRGEDEGWRFSPQTLEDLDAMWESVRAEDQIAGRRVSFTEDPDLWMDQNFPRWLTRTDLILRNYQWASILLLIFIGVVADRFFRFYAGRLIARFLERQHIQYDSDFLPVATKWFGWTVAGIVWVVGVSALNLPERMVVILDIAARFLAVAAGVMAALAVTDLMASIFMLKARKTATKFDDILVPLIRKAVKVFITTVGIIFIADNMQVNITSLLAGLGIGGLAFALAAKDTVENLFGSITILIDRPFQIGDWVCIDNVEGNVEALGLRSTRIRTFYNSLITVPNSNLIKANVDNLGMRRYRRFRTHINVTYNTPPEKIDAFCEGIRELIRQHPYTWKSNYHVWLNEFGPHSLDILIHMFHETPDWATELRERHRLMSDIVRLAKRIGVEFAFPTQTLYLERGSGPAVPDDSPFVNRAGIIAGREQARSHANEMVDELLRNDGFQNPPPPVSFNLPLDAEEDCVKKALKMRGESGDAGGSSGDGEGGR
ncbi:MAG: mechanosensitive ion channel family protein [Candidatus Sumerlaeia bacterium]|nr:mechanosensitive ion channel family protein [Candidatus Sumerlaeia bacterium]